MLFFPSLPQKCIVSFAKVCNIAQGTVISVWTRITPRSPCFPSPYWSSCPRYTRRGLFRPAVNVHCNFISFLFHASAAQSSQSINWMRGSIYHDSTHECTWVEPPAFKSYRSLALPRGLSLFIKIAEYVGSRMLGNCPCTRWQIYSPNRKWKICWTRVYQNRTFCRSAASASCFTVDNKTDPGKQEWEIKLIIVQSILLISNILFFIRAQFHSNLL